jgi:hypothetical protein
LYTTAAKATSAAYTAEAGTARITTDMTKTTTAAGTAAVGVLVTKFSYNQGGYKSSGCACNCPFHEDDCNCMIAAAAISGGAIALGNAIQKVTKERREKRDIVFARKNSSNQ